MQIIICLFFVVFILDNRNFSDYFLKFNQNTLLCFVDIEDYLNMWENLPEDANMELRHLYKKR